MAPPIVTATLQSAILGVVSSILAQLITAFKQETSMRIDWVPVFQYLVFIVISTPPNFYWQELIEKSFPSYPEPSVVYPASKTDDNGSKSKINKTARTGDLSKRNTAIKFLLDQTLGAAVNTLLFSTFTRSLRMASGHAPRITSIRKAVRYWVSSRAIDFAAVDYGLVWREAKEEFWPIVSAGYKLWPLVSLINFTLVKSVQGRNLVGALAGVGWGVYVCLDSAT